MAKTEEVHDGSGPDANLVAARSMAARLLMLALIGHMGFYVLYPSP